VTFSPPNAKPGGSHESESTTAPRAFPAYESGVRGRYLSGGPAGGRGAAETAICGSWSVLRPAAHPALSCGGCVSPPVGQARPASANPPLTPRLPGLARQSLGPGGVTPLQSADGGLQSEPAAGAMSYSSSHPSGCSNAGAGPAGATSYRSGCTHLEVGRVLEAGQTPSGPAEAGPGPAIILGCIPALPGSHSMRRGATRQGTEPVTSRPKRLGSENTGPAGAIPPFSQPTRPGRSNHQIGGNHGTLDG